jgi:hypothetical protein
MYKFVHASFGQLWAPGKLNVHIFIQLNALNSKTTQLSCLGQIIRRFVTWNLFTTNFSINSLKLIIAIAKDGRNPRDSPAHRVPQDVWSKETSEFFWLFAEVGSES